LSFLWLQTIDEYKDYRLKRRNVTTDKARELKNNPLNLPKGIKSINHEKISFKELYLQIMSMCPGNKISRSCHIIIYHRYQRVLPWSNSHNILLYVV